MTTATFPVWSGTSARENLRGVQQVRQILVSEDRSEPVPFAITQRDSLIPSLCELCTSPAVECIRCQLHHPSHVPKTHGSPEAHRFSAMVF